jgi:hypothetical protein
MGSEQFKVDQFFAKEQLVSFREANYILLPKQTKRRPKALQNDLSMHQITTFDYF